MHSFCRCRRAPIGAFPTLNIFFLVSFRNATPRLFADVSFFCLLFFPAKFIATHLYHPTRIQIDRLESNYYWVVRPIFVNPF